MKHYCMYLAVKYYRILFLSKWKLYTLNTLRVMLCAMSPFALDFCFHTLPLE